MKIDWIYLFISTVFILCLFIAAGAEACGGYEKIVYIEFEILP